MEADREEKDKKGNIKRLKELGKIFEKVELF